ncbi:MAG: phosphatidylglycerophosphatase A family protein [Thermodesulfobacteriota bacterium]
MNFFILLLATGLGVGYFPFIPGTVGTILAILIHFFLSQIPFPLYEFTLLGLFFISCWISERAEIFFGKRDDPRIVIDEIFGFLITMIWLPKTLHSILLGFIFFRFLDILKPFPIHTLETKLKGGYGVVMDDVIAGLYGNMIIRLLISLNLVSGGLPIRR